MTKWELGMVIAAMVVGNIIYACVTSTTFLTAIDRSYWQAAGAVIMWLAIRRRT